jgi:hypothetical protein
MQGMMKFGVRCRRHQFKVINPVVQSVTIPVMHVLTVIKTAPEMLFHYYTVFTAPAGSARTDFDPPIDELPACMKANSSQR